MCVIGRSQWGRAGQAHTEVLGGQSPQCGSYLGVAGLGGEFVCLVVYQATSTLKSGS